VSARGGSLKNLKDLKTPVHWGKPLHVFGLTSEVSVVGAHMSLTMGYHGPSADLLCLGVCVRHEPPGPNSYALLGIPFSRLLPRSSVQGGLM